MKIYKIYDKIVIFIERLQKFFLFGKFSWKIYDFDFSSVYEIMYFQMKNVRKSLEYSKKYVIHDVHHLRALDEAINIINRLRKDEYENKFYDIHEERWGKTPPFRFGPEKNGASELFLDKRPKVITKEDEAQERKEFLQISEKTECARKIDLDRLNLLLKKYSRAWWW